jgi:cell division protease FtsH
VEERAVDKTRFNYLYVFLAMMGVLLLHDAIVRFQQVAPIPYSDFQRLLREGKAKEVVATADRIQGELTEPEGGRNDSSRTGSSRTWWPSSPGTT